MDRSTKKPKKSLKYCCICKGIYRGKVIDGRVISLHRFPQNKILRRVWVQRCKTVMRTFVLNDNRLLCSQHFEGLSGTTEAHNLPTRFPTEKGGLKQFPTSKLDFEEEYDDHGKEIGSVSFGDGVASSREDIERQDEESMDDDQPNANLPEAETMMDISIHLHDYCEGPAQMPAKMKSRSEYVQTYIDANCVETQTNSQPIKVSKDAACQTDNGTADAGIQCNLPILTYEDVRNNDELLSFYTGIPNNEVFEALFDEIKEDAEEQTSRRKLNISAKSGGRPKSLSLVNEFFMVLMRLRLGLLIEDLCARFCMSSSQCSDICNRWIDYLTVQLSFLVQWPSKETIQTNMPKIFKEKFPDTRIIIDCTEIYTETPSSLKLKSLMYSDYKSHMTYKALVGISPNGVVTFVSDLWCGGISDKQITEACGLLDFCSEGDAIMVDKGFTITDLTTPKGIRLIIPPFRKKNVQFPQQDVLLTK